MKLHIAWAKDCILPLWHLSARSLPTLGGVVTPLNCFASVEGFVALYVYSGPKNFRWIKAAKLKKMVVWQWGVRGDNVFWRVKGFSFCSGLLTYELWRIEQMELTVRRCPTRCSGLFVGVIKWLKKVITTEVCDPEPSRCACYIVIKDSQSWAF